MAGFEYRDAEDVCDAFKRHGVKYLFFGKSGAILLGFSDTTQDVDVFVEKRAANCEQLATALSDLGFRLIEEQTQEIRRGEALIQPTNGPFDLDLVFSPDGIETFEDAWKRHLEPQGFPVAHIDDIVASKEAANRRKDKESLPRLLSFRAWLKKEGKL